MLEENLKNIISEALRREFSKTLTDAYRVAVADQLNFGSFAARSLGYLKHFYSNAYLERLAIREKLAFEITPNSAKNDVHLAISLTNNWTLTPHQVSSKTGLPKRAQYRAHYASYNLELFPESDSADPKANDDQGYVLLLHSGHHQLDSLSLVVPNEDLGSVIHSEPIALMDSMDVEEEEIEDKVKDSIRVNVEQLIRKTNE